MHQIILRYISDEGAVVHVAGVEKPLFVNLLTELGELIYDNEPPFEHNNVVRVTVDIALSYAEDPHCHHRS